MGSGGRKGDKGPLLNRAAAKIPALAGYGAFCAWFTYRYVPLVPGYLAVLVPILLFLTIRTALDEKKGLVAFSFLFPLINCVPYFFGLGEGLPLAPAALCAFLAFYLGKLVGGFRTRIGAGGLDRNLIEGGGAVGKTRQDSTDDGRIGLPLTLLAAWGWISAVVAFLRYMDFFPLAASGIHELQVNAAGVTTGGARMSVVFAAASLLAGIAMFGVYKRACADGGMRNRLVGAMAVAATIAFLFGLLQKVLASPPGNTSYWRELGQVNATFKDPNSLAAFIAAFLPVLIAFAVSCKGWRRATLIAVGCAGIILLPLSGSRSGIAAIGVAAAAFLLEAFWRAGRKTRIKVSAVAAAIVLAFVLWNTVIVHDSSLAERIGWSLYQLKEETAPGDFFNHRLALWDGARRMFREAPLTGIGLGAFIVQFPDYLQVKPGEERFTDTALNLAFQIGAETGMIGLALTLLFLAALMRRMARVFREAASGKPRDWISIGAVSGLAAFFFLFLFHTYAASYEIQFLFWFLAAVVFAGTSGTAAEAAIGSSADMRKTAEQRGVWEASSAASANRSGSATNAGPISLTTSVSVGSDRSAAEEVFKRAGGVSRRPAHRWVKYGAAGALLAGGMIFLFFSLGPYSISVRAERGGWKLEYGLYAEEPDAEVGAFRWTTGEAGFSLAGRAGGEGEGGRIELMLRALNPDLNRRPVSVKIYSANKHFRKIAEIGSATLRDTSWMKVTMDLPSRGRSDGASGPLYLVVKPDRTWNPGRLHISADKRDLGVGIK